MECKGQIHHLQSDGLHRESMPAFDQRTGFRSCEGLLAGGPGGLHKELLRLKANATEAVAMKYVCEECGYVYDPAEGDPDGDIAPGTPFEDLPVDWVCPICGAPKKAFQSET